MTNEKREALIEKARRRSSLASTTIRVDADAEDHAWMGSPANKQPHNWGERKDAA